MDRGDEAKGRVKQRSRWRRVRWVIGIALAICAVLAATGCGNQGNAHYTVKRYAVEDSSLLRGYFHNDAKHVIVTYGSTVHFFDSLTDVLSNTAKPAYVVTAYTEGFANVDYDGTVTYDSRYVRDRFPALADREIGYKLFWGFRYLDTPILPDVDLSHVLLGEDQYLLGSIATDDDTALLLTRDEHYWLQWVQSQDKRQLRFFSTDAVTAYSDFSTEYGPEPWTAAMQKEADSMYLDACLMATDGERVVMFNYPRELIAIADKEHERDIPIAEIIKLIPGVAPGYAVVEGLVGCSRKYLYVGFRDKNAPGQTLLYSFSIGGDLTLRYHDALPPLPLDEKEFDYATMSCLNDDIAVRYGDYLYRINPRK